MLWVLGLLLCVGFSGQAQEWKVNVGEQTPKFEIKGKNEQKITSESLRGKVVLLNFFATWCPPCRKELPRLQKEIWDGLKENKDLAVFVLAGKKATISWILLWRQINILSRFIQI